MKLVDLFRRGRKEAPKKRVWVCDKGHQNYEYARFRFGDIESKPLCIQCFVDFMNTNVSESQEEK